MAPVSGTCVMRIWDWIHLVPDSGADRTLFYSKPESGVHCTEVHNKHSSQIKIFIVCSVQFTALDRIYHFDAFIFAARIFIPDAYGTKTGPKTGARKWSRFMAPVSGTSVTHSSKLCFLVFLYTLGLTIASSVKTMIKRQARWAELREAAAT